MNSQTVLGTQDQPLQLTPLAASCFGGSCPTVYRTDRGTIVVQGYAVNEVDAGLALPPGELLVEIPSDLLEQAMRNSL